MRTEIKLKIAEIVILLRSDFGLFVLSKEEREERDYGRFSNFIYRGKKMPEITIDVHIIDRLPRIETAGHVFIAYHFQDKKENWRIARYNGRYVFKTDLEDKQQVVFIDKDFTKVDVYILPMSGKGRTWGIADITDDFVHILLINFLGYHNRGFFAHGMGIRDNDGKGMLFCGKSGAGKSTSAKIWFKHTRAMILNDDRIIVLAKKSGYSIHSVPWHGEFHSNFSKCLKPAPLKKLFFIYHAKNNVVSRINPRQAFGLLYSTIFPGFWDKHILDKTVRFCADMVQKVPCYRLGFINDEKIIAFVRDMERHLSCERVTV